MLVSMTTEIIHTPKIVVLSILHHSFTESILAIKFHTTNTIKQNEISPIHPKSAYREMSTLGYVYRTINHRINLFRN